MKCSVCNANILAQLAMVNIRHYSHHPGSFPDRIWFKPVW